MKKTQVFALIGCMTLGLLILVLFILQSPFASDIPRQVFSRNFDNNIYLAKRTEIDLTVNSFYFAGASKNNIYLGNKTGPYHVVQVGLPKLDTLHFNVSIKDLELPQDYKRFTLAVDSPHFYLSHGVMPGIFKGTLSNREATPFLPIKFPYFIDAVPISPALIALKSYSTKDSSVEVATLTTKPPYLEFKPTVLEKQIDGFFCVDGTLLRDKEQNRMVYVYGYRNEYIVTDTSFKSINRYHTIDTFSRAPILVSDVKSKNYSTISSPAQRNNLASSIADGKLFIRSPHLASNENKVSFQKGSPIDVYDINNGQYLYSFHLESLHGKSPTDFIVVNDFLLAIEDHYLTLYRIYLPKQKELAHSTKR
jgi:hypothetical protein